MSKADICIIGLGRFGMQVAKSLQSNNNNLLLIDTRDELVQLASKEFEYVVRADATDLNTLDELGLRTFSTVIVGVSNIEASIMICANLKEVKVKNIIARAKNVVHKRVLNTMGVKDSVIPEEIVGQNVALKVIHNLSADISLLGEGISFVKTAVTNQEIFERKLADLNLRRYGGANVISIQRDGELIFPITATTILKQGDLVSAVCKSEDIDSFIEYVTLKKD
ncbi:potassium channel family protein [[Mycoplasma] testudinis]|uniref:potassium channel family protein n=1 Tax=[Mycoplasma] testudinis TaxID=33924 RepID=UPI00048849DB|nr:TrkA family potassium uptake protein [[Mycoplasma] testudinis]